MNREESQTAFLGTGHHPLPPLSPDDPPLLHQLHAGTAEELLLLRQGVRHWYERAGQLPPRAVNRPSYAPVQPPHHEGLFHCWQKLVDGNFFVLLPELSRLTTAIGRTIPTPFLPLLLERGIAISSDRPHILPAMGAQGGWLANHNVAWAYASEEASGWDGAWALWRQADPTQRQGFLRQLRLTNPELGLAMVEATWKSDPNHLRHAYVKLLQFGLSMGDEPFLEQALDDRYPFVRRESADLLTRLPMSRLAGRMKRVAQSLLQRHGQTIQPLPALVVSAELQRDGVPTSASHNDPLRLRAEQYQRLFLATPLSTWTAIAPAEQWLAELTNHKWGRVLLQAWIMAAERQADASWAEALITHTGWQPLAHRLIKVVSAEQQLIFCQQLLTQHPLPLHREHLLLKLLGQIEGDWSRQSADFWLTTFEQHTQQSREDGAHPLIGGLHRKLALHCPPTFLPTALARLQPYLTQPQWAPHVREALRLLQFRHTIYHLLGVPSDE